MDEQPSPHDTERDKSANVWHTYLTTGGSVKGMNLPWFEHPFFRPIYKALPAEPRCHICYIPFEGIGGFVSRRLLNVKPSNMNPHLCDTCERFAERYPGGTEIEITILFADIRGSTPMAEKMSNREFSEMIQRFYVAGTKALYANNGLIDKFVGDGLTAFFSPAYAGANHALTGIRAANDILEATGHGEGKTPWIPVGVGVDTGVAYVGAMKVDGGRTDIAILGDVVNTTARLSSAAAAGEVLVGPGAMKMSGLAAENYEKRALSLKGKQDAVEAWAIKSLDTT